MGEQEYCPQSTQSIVSTFSIENADTSSLEAFYIQITSGYDAVHDQLLLQGSHPEVQTQWIAAEAKLVLRGTAGNIAISAIENAVKDIVFYSSDPNITHTKEFSLTAGGANYLPSTGHYYQYINNTNITWQQARTAAANSTYFGLQGYLATLTSQNEAQLAGELSPGVGWIGGSDQAEEGVWKWMDGPEAGTVFWNGGANGYSPNFAFWNTGEPNDVGNNEDYAHITDNSIGVRGSWNDLPNQTPTSGPYQAKGYLIEYGGMPNDPEIKISASTRLIVGHILTHDDIVVCEGEIATLGVTSTNNQAFWFDREIAGNLIASGLEFSTAVTTTTTYWVQAQALACENPKRVAVQVMYNPLPKPLTDLITVEQCDDDGVNNGQSLFNLSAYEPQLSNNHTQEYFYYYRSPDFAEDGLIESPENFENEAFIQDVYVKIISLAGCVATTQLQLRIGASEIPNELWVEYIDCENPQKDFYDGIEPWPQSVFIEIREALLASNPTFTNQNMTIDLYRSEADAQTQTQAIDIDSDDFNFMMSTPYTQEIWAYVQAIDLNQVRCIGLKKVALLRIEPPPAFQRVDANSVVCLDGNPVFLAVSSTDDRNYTYQWELDGNPLTLEPNEDTSVLRTSKGGNYTVIAQTTDRLECQNSISFYLLASEKATLYPEDIVVDDLNANNNNTFEIVSEDLGIGNYEFALGDMIGGYQDDPLFTDIKAGIYPLYVRDKNGCGVIELAVAALGYKPFFTPNGDGINDSWNIEGIRIENTQLSKVFVFDRYGKLLESLDPMGPGWDGTFNGFALPADDYWFRFYTHDGRELVGHFSLIR